jgi:hypothetical protein
MRDPEAGTMRDDWKRLLSAVLASALPVLGPVASEPQAGAQAPEQPARASAGAGITPAPTPVKPAPAPPKAAGASFDRLRGRWLRTAGGYVLEIRSVSPVGKVDAAYLNPRSIHVARAEAGRAGKVVEVLVELRDVNYPGSTYRLSYDPGRDMLVGTYYQAVERQMYEVSFVRQPEEGAHR